MIDAYDLAKSCASKNAYPSEDKAREVALDCWRERGVSLRVYLCDCGQYHLTRSNAAPVMKPGWRPPAKSQRALARERRRRRHRR